MGFNLQLRDNVIASMFFNTISAVGGMSRQGIVDVKQNEATDICELSLNNYVNVFLLSLYTERHISRISYILCKQ